MSTIISVTATTPGAIVTYCVRNHYICGYIHLYMDSFCCYELLFRKNFLQQQCLPLHKLPVQ